ncbi:hypothetical protein ACRALDRAFT_1075083 [Sodiomyces alcalophilus JCM 7366]|uniref:uncharacterized protein n=1 Tax=Sodiomyces alcalophilus JCM 7366 TaxID=591952 RepID=UPI0039B4139A
MWVTVHVSTKTSPNTSPSLRSSPSHRDGIGSPRLPTQSSSPFHLPHSPAFSTASTAADDQEIGSSPPLPPLPAPRLPGRAQGLLRAEHPDHQEDEDPYVTASWGSPYPHRQRHRLQRESSSSSSSSEPDDDDLPIHHLELRTPFLRPPPDFVPTSAETHRSETISAAQVLANRARRPARGLTEDWIRQHTAGDNSESRHWLSDGDYYDDSSEHSSLSGSQPGEDDSDHWIEKDTLRTPRATIAVTPRATRRKTSSHHPRNRSSIETLKPEHNAKLGNIASTAAMASPQPENATSVAVADDKAPASAQEMPAPPETPTKQTTASRGPKMPVTPAKVTFKEPARAPRARKKVPWKGKNIVVLVPVDESRGQPGAAPIPLTAEETARMYQSWEELGYCIAGFDLQGHGPTDNNAQSRADWPSAEDMTTERSSKPYQVTLPDLNAWKNYVDELNEAKLRALGVSFGDEEEPAPPSISPAPSAPSRQASAQYPTLPFSPPLPTSSASSNPAHGFPFPPQFIPGAQSAAAAQSPAAPSVASPVSFAGAPGKFNPRQSISIPMGHSPFQPGHQPSPSLSGWPMSHPAGRTDSPGMLNGIMSPMSPFMPEGFQPSGNPAVNMHQRHQSLQYPIMPHQQLVQQPSARASPRLQEVQEVDEETIGKSPSKSPEPPQKINGNDGLQSEINEAEYHLEEQMRNELEHADYSPHHTNRRPEDSDPMQMASASEKSSLPHSRQASSVQFQVPRHFANPMGDGPVLHHPRPHSRGHSLTKKNFFDGEPRHSADDGSMNHFSAWQDVNSQNAQDVAEIETNPSNLGTPVQDFNIAALLQQHQRSFSTASNPWDEPAPRMDSPGVHHRPSHGSKPSFSKLNVNAPEFKFNPNKEFEPSGHFVFGDVNPNIDVVPSHEPVVFQATADPFMPPVAVAPPPPFAFGSSQMSVDAPSFTPGQSDFNFTASGPKFRPDAPSFTPIGALSSSFASPPASGSEADRTGPNSIFGNIDLSEIANPAKKSKAIPIVRPSTSDSKSRQKSPADDRDDDRIADDESRVKRAKASRGDEDSVPRFAEPTPGPELEAVEPAPAFGQEDLTASGTRSTDEEGATADMSISPEASEHLAESKVVTATSPSDASQGQPQMQWTPFDLEHNLDAREPNDARPFDEDRFKKGHKKSLSATARAFVPGAMWVAPQKPESEQEPEPDQEDLQGREDTVESPTHQTSAPTEKPSPPPQAAPTEARQPSPVVQVPAMPPALKRPLRKGLGASRFASPPPQPKDLVVSRFASPSPEPEPEGTADIPAQPVTSEPEEVDQDIASVQEPFEDLPPNAGDEATGDEHRELTFEEIDAVMDHLTLNDPTQGVNKASAEEPQWQMSIATVTNSSPYHLQPDPQLRSDAPSPSPRKYQQIPDLVVPRPSTELEDPFVDPPQSARSIEPPIYRLNGSEAVANSDWDGTFSDDEQEKLEQRVQFFDGRVNAHVSEILDTRLQPIEKTLALLERHLARGMPLSVRERRSASLDYQHSDADDEDDEPVMPRSISPRRDRRMEQMRAIVNDALQAHLRNAPPVPVPAETTPDTAVLSALDELKAQLSANLRPDFPTGEDFRTIVADVIESRMPAGDEQQAMNDKLSQFQAKIDDLEERLQGERNEVEKERKARRDAEELAAELNKKLQAAETRLEVEIMNRSIYDQRVGDVEDRLKQQEAQTENEIAARRAVEDKLSEAQRLLRIATEEGNQLRDAVEERNQKIKSMEQSTAKSTMRMSLLEAAQNNSAKSQTEFTNRTSILENDLRAARQEANHYKAEAERASETSQRHLADLNNVREESTQQQRFLDTLGTQLQENERIRESWRAKFLSLQDEMTKAAREITEENARRTKREQALVARQEVLDARLQAEARTRERLETEIERLETGERQGLRAVSECKRLEGLLAEMRTENHQLQQSALRYQREFEEARESGASEVERTRKALQFEIDQANNQVNVVRRDLEEHIAKLQAELDQATMDAESSKARADMLVEGAQSSKAAEVAQLTEKHQNEIEDLQTRHAMQLGNTIEEAQKAEQHLLERLSLSTSKTDHLQDRVAHLEEKLEIAKEAALAAAKRARSQSQSPTVKGPQTSATPAGSHAAYPAPATERAESGVPEKISPQALRESIMVLQEQLQAREQRIEELEHTIEKVDPDATSKIAKRDDEITWLRELLAVRHGDLQDIIHALSTEDYNKDAVKDAAIRLKANLQMEEQERERAMNGGSAINLLQAASPRVAQAVGPLAAAWGNWRKSQQQPGRTGSFGSLAGALSSPAGAPGGRNNSTPSKSTSTQSPGSLLGGLLTPPASGIRQTLPNNPSGSQPTAFNATGRRLTSQELARGSRGPSAGTAQVDKQLQRDDITPPRRPSRGQPVTPPMMRPSAYDSDANPHEFDENDFFQED